MQNLEPDWASVRHLRCQSHIAGFSLTVIQVEERARYLGALDQGWSRHSSACHAEAPMEQKRTGAKELHVGKLLDRILDIAGTGGFL